MTTSNSPSGSAPHGKPPTDIARLDFSLSEELADFLDAADRAAGALVGRSAPADGAFVPSEDSDLVLRARTDPEAFGLLYERYVDRIYAYVYHRVGNGQDAEDLTARTFHRALDNLHRYEDRGLPFAAWLFRIAHNLVANWHRDRSRRRFLSLDRIWSHRSDTDSPEGALGRQGNARRTLGGNRQPPWRSPRPAALQVLAAPLQRGDWRDDEQERERH